jgi:hypothetical protein
MITLVLLVSAMWLQAQDSMSKSGPTTITGCLATLGNHYTLTDSNGKVYQLSDEANKLTKHVGHEVKITGMPGVRTTDTTMSGSESTAKETPVIRVKTVTHIADKCN